MEPTYDPSTGKVTIPNRAGVIYTINGRPVKGTVDIDGPTTVTASPRGAVRFRDGITTEWHFGADPVDRSSTAEDPPGAGDLSEEAVE